MSEIVLRPSEQAGKNIGIFDAAFRVDLAPLWEFTLEAWEHARAVENQRLKTGEGR